MRVLLGIVLGIVLVLGSVYLYFRLGYAPVATAAPPMPFETSMAQAALHARMAREAPSSAPIQPDEANLAAGARIYRDTCAVCHGLRGEPETGVAQGMFPKPPQFFAHTTNGRAVGQAYWAVKNGIRLTGMPSFVPSMTDAQLWQVSLFVSQPDKVAAGR